MAGRFFKVGLASTCTLVVGCVVISGILPVAPIVVGTFLVAGTLGSISNNETATTMVVDLSNQTKHNLGLPPTQQLTKVDRKYDPKNMYRNFVFEYINTSHNFMQLLNYIC